MTTFQCITQLAERQHGAVARWQLVDRGLTNGQIGAAVRHGRIERAQRGVYRLVGAPRTPMFEVMVDVLRAGRGARAAGERMLAACGVRDAAEDGPFHVVVPPGRQLVTAPVDWRPDEHPGCGREAEVRGVPSWSIPRNLLEAARHDDDDRVRCLADGVRRTSRRRMAAVRELVVDHPDHPGARRLLLLGCLDLDAAESPMERVLEVVLAELGFQRQVELTPDIRVDFFVPSLGVVVEYDGSDHESGEAQVRDDARDGAIEALGFAVVRVRAADLRDPQALLTRIRAAATR